MSFRIHGNLFMIYISHAFYLLLCMIGYRMKIYVSKLILGTGITASLEVLSLEFPRSVHQLDAFTTRRSFDDLVHMDDMFRDNCLNRQEAKIDTTTNALELPILNAIRQLTKDRTRLNHLQY